MIRKATCADLDGVEALYLDIHDAEERGIITTGWLRDVYPVRATAEAALTRDDLFVMEEDGRLIGAAIINQVQVDVYDGAAWEYEASPDEVCVLHTLVISPAASGKGFGSAFVRYYEDYARARGCLELRMDTNARNRTARQLYAKRGYKEIGVVPTVFNGIPGVQLVLLEKHL
ncbi:MAG: GNAT family N-acetyltransferase [Oscillospiraceae bacterium]|nr:GNAT family N-acetyltransferase [Oscillospiraceae bacterium]